MTAQDREHNGMPRAIVISIDGFAGFYWTDGRLRIPTLRRLAERGVVGPRMEAVLPTTTWPTHVSLVTGVQPRVHGVAANSILNRATGEPEDLTGDPIYDAARLLRAPTIYDVAHAAGLRTAAVDWPATRNARSLDFNLPFFKDQTVFEAQTSRSVWRELTELGYPVERQGEWAQQPKRFMKDRMVGDLAAHVWRRHRPDLMLVHFLAADSFQHLYGPRSPEAYWAIEYIDERIGRFVAELPARELERETALFVVSDHGFLPVDREIRVNVWLRQQGLLSVDAHGRVDRAAARFVMNHGVGYLYLLASRRRPRWADSLGDELKALEGVSAVWRDSEYPALGIPTPAENAQTGDLLLEAAPGYGFSDDASGDDVIVTPPRYRGTHGQRPDHPDNLAFFLALGSGIRGGLELPRLASRDVAPTLARTLGVEMADVEGRQLAEIFS